MKTKSLYLRNANRWFENLPNRDIEHITGYSEKIFQGGSHEDDFLKKARTWWASLPDDEKISVWMKNKT